MLGKCLLFFGFDIVAIKLYNYSMEHKNIGKIHGIDYHTYIQSEAWQMKRQMVAKLANYTCQRCHKVVLKGFHVHHLTYKRFGNEALSDLMFLCEDCHNKIHGIAPKRRAKQVHNGKKYKNKRPKVIKQHGKTLVGVREEMSGIVCSHCGCKEFNIYKLSTNVGIYCSVCGKYIKFLNAKEREKLGM